MKQAIITSEDAFRGWLKHKPKEWAQAVALRAALRALPIIVNSSESWLRNFALLPFGAVLTSWVQLTDQAIFVRTDESRANARFGGHSFDFTGYKKEPIAALAADASYHSADAQSQSMHVFDDCVKGAGKAADAFRLELPSDTDQAFKPVSGELAFWQSVATDCDWLDGEGESDKSAGRLSLKPLWQSAHPTNWFREWGVLAHQLLQIDPNFSAWIDWYERRIRGERPAFDFPGDKYRREDKAILRRLAEATDEDFWGKGHEYVNATLQGWLYEARAKVSPKVERFILDYVAEPAPPLQNRNAISFRQDSDGRIAIDTHASTAQLRSDADARDRHAETILEIRAVLDRCRGNNAAARLTLRLENYLDAAGVAIEDIKPSLLVQRGERLRQELAAYDSPDSMFDPIADDILVDLKGWQSSHNMLVGLDPILMAIDTAMLGPDRKPALIPPDEIRQVAHDAEEAGILANGTEAIIIEAADLAPVVPDLADRRSIASAEVARNLVIEAFAVALNHPKATGAIMVAGATLTTNPAAGVIGGISIMGSIKAAEYLVNHRQWIEDKLGKTLTWQTLFRRVADWLEKVSPFKPK